MLILLIPKEGLRVMDLMVHLDSEEVLIILMEILVCLKQLLVLHRQQIT